MSIQEGNRYEGTLTIAADSVYKALIVIENFSSDNFKASLSVRKQNDDLVESTLLDIVIDPIDDNSSTLILMNDTWNLGGIVNLQTGEISLDIYSGSEIIDFGSISVARV